MFIPSLRRLCAEKLVECGQPLPDNIPLEPRDCPSRQVTRLVWKMTQRRRTVLFRHKQDALDFLLLARQHGFKVSEITFSKDVFRTVTRIRQRCKCLQCKMDDRRGDRRHHNDGSHRTRRQFKIPLFEIQVFPDE